MSSQEGESQAADDAFDRENLNEDVTRMRVLWTNEMARHPQAHFYRESQSLRPLSHTHIRSFAQNAPELLPYDDEMVAEMLDQIRNQVCSQFVRLGRSWL